MIKLGNLSVCLEKRQVSSEGAVLRLSTRAFAILELLLQRVGNVVPQEEILRTVWCRRVVEESNIQVHICALRKALGEARAIIQTVPGHGYRLMAPHLADRAAATVAYTDLPGPKAYAAKCLPPRRSLLIGRDATVREVCDALEESLLVTLVGPGGVGKTQIAIEAASRHGASVCLIDLAREGDASPIDELVALAIGAPNSAVGTLGAMTAHLGGRSLLVILDTCEHRIGEVADFCNAVLSSDGQIRVLATSQQPLNIKCEQLLWVEPLQTPTVDARGAEILASPAVQLFALRARSHDSRWSITEVSALDVAELCRRVDGIPLVIEFVAERVSVVGLREALVELDGCGGDLGGNAFDAPRRQKTLLDSFQWSNQLLNHSERKALGFMSSLPGKYDFGTLCNMLVGKGYSRRDAVGAILGLKRKSILTCSIAGSAPQYFLLETAKIHARIISRNHHEEPAFSPINSKAALVKDASQDSVNVKNCTSTALCSVRPTRQQVRKRTADTAVA